MGQEALIAVRLLQRDLEGGPDRGGLVRLHVNVFLNSEPVVDGELPPKVLVEVGFESEVESPILEVFGVVLDSCAEAEQVVVFEIEAELVVVRGLPSSSLGAAIRMLVDEERFLLIF